MKFQLCRVNLKNRVITSEDLDELHPYGLLAGRALSSTIIGKEVPAENNPLGITNKLVFAIGFLTGTTAPNSGRMSIGSQSPLTHGIKESNVGGRTPTLLAQHGIRAIIVEGQSNSWVTLEITSDHQLILSDLSDDEALLNTYATAKKFQQNHPKRTGLLCIGSAGARLWPTASIASTDLEGNPSRHAGRGGLGAVMGSKRMKAIVIQPPNESVIYYTDAPRFSQVSQKLYLQIHHANQYKHTFGTLGCLTEMHFLHGLPTQNFRRGQFADFEKINGDALYSFLRQNSGKSGIPCSPNCAIQCSNIVRNAAGEYLTSSLEYETVGMFGSNLLINDLEKIAQMDHICDDLGVDSIEMGNSMAVLMEAQKISWGDADGVLVYLRSLYQFSDQSTLLGQGAYQVAKYYHVERVAHVKGQSLPAYEPRALKSPGITFCTNPMGADHTAGDMYQTYQMRRDRDLTGVSKNRQKIALSRAQQQFIMLVDSFGICYFVHLDIPMLSQYAELIHLQYGVSLHKTPIEWIQWAKKHLELECKFNQQAGLPTIDQLPSFFLNETVEDTELHWNVNDSDLQLFWCTPQIRQKKPNTE